MKTTITTILALMTCAVAFSACTRELIEEPANERPVLSGLRTMTFTAVQEKQDSTTKAAIDGRDIKWSKSDALSVFDGTGNRKFTLVGEGGSTSGTFTGSAAAASTYYAIYRYRTSCRVKRDLESGCTKLCRGRTHIIYWVKRRVPVPLSEEKSPGRPGFFRCLGR